ncbi:MAG TPA: RNA polymerase sigma factor [Gemmatimonadales bacterium]|jgi:RNA polymerase sigma-70 factor (ECF subfamily)
MGAPVTADIADSELIARFQNGDEKAATELVLRHTAALARFLAVQGAPDDELDDVVQDAFFKAFRGIGGFRGGSSFRTWLLTIGGNVLKDRQRQWKRRHVVELMPDVADPSADPQGDADAAWAAERLQEGLGRLARLQREVFLLRAQQGAEYPDIAASLGISEGAARVHYHHAVKRLKAWMQT